MTSNRTHLINWIRSNIERCGYSSFEDLHLEDFPNSFAGPGGKLGAMADACEILASLRSEFPTGFTICIGVSLRSDQSPIGVNFQDELELASELTYNTPSVYVFEAGVEPWKTQFQDAAIIPPHTFSWDKNSSYSVHFEYKEDYESQYRRSFWIVV
ncbi:MAG: hypothetical protein KDB22_29020 [Planctomycetales bacterium]|nr:hypothetical protein [Planctomycetales bacterium]